MTDQNVHDPGCKASTISSPMLLGYALLRANFSEQRGNFTDNFAPFVLDAVRSRHPSGCTDEEASNYVREQYGIMIPALVSRSLLRRAERGGRLTREGGTQGPPRYTCSSTELSNGTSVSANYASSTRQQNALSDALLAFAQKNYPDLAEHLNRDSCSELIAAYMDSNALPLLRSSIRGSGAATDLAATEHFLVSEFIATAYDSNQEHFNAFVEIAKGATLAAVIQMDVSSLEASLRNLAIYLDTSLVINLLGYHGIEGRSATLDMLELAKNLGAKILVFDHTVREVRSVLEAAKESLRSSHKGTENFRVALYFLEAGMSAADVEIAIQRLEDLVRAHGIKIEAKPEDYGSFGLDESQLEENVRREVHRQNIAATHFDVDSIHAVHRLRRGQAGARFDQARAFFVTSNRGVVRAANKSREELHEFPLVVLDSTLASLLWIRSPLLASDLPAKQVIATAWAGMQPDPRRWMEYLADVERLEATGEISHDDAVLIRMSSESQHELMRESQGKPERFATVSPSTILSNLRARETAPLKARIAELRQENEESVEQKRHAEESESSLRARLDEVSRIQVKTADELTRLANAQDSRRSSVIAAGKKRALHASRLVLALLVLLIIGSAGAVAMQPSVGNEWPEWVKSVVVVAGVMLAVLIALASVTNIDLFKLRGAVESRLSPRAVNRSLRNAGLDIEPSDT